MLSIGMSGDGLYFYGTMATRLTTYALRRRLPVRPAPSVDDRTPVHG